MIRMQTFGNNMTMNEPISMVGAEVQDFHTRLLRVSLALEDSQIYWQHWKSLSQSENPSLLAFENRWFGSKSLNRVKLLLATFHHRYDPYLEAIQVLSAWCPRDPISRQNLVHWFTQLSDPIYRRFTGSFLANRRLQTDPIINRDIVARWVPQAIQADWASATTLRMATALITCATAAGLCQETTGNRRLTYPQVSDEALVYWLYVLRSLKFDGSLLENPYFASVGLSEGGLEQRVRRLQGLSFNRMGDLHEFNWQYPVLKDWAEAELELRGLSV